MPGARLGAARAAAFFYSYPVSATRCGRSSHASSIADFRWTSDPGTRGLARVSIVASLLSALSPARQSSRSSSPPPLWRLCAHTYLSRVKFRCCPPKPQFRPPPPPARSGRGVLCRRSLRSGDACPCPRALPQTIPPDKMRDGQVHVARRLPCTATTARSTRIPVQTPEGNQGLIALAHPLSLSLSLSCAPHRLPMASCRHWRWHGSQPWRRRRGGVVVLRRVATQ